MVIETKYDIGDKLFYLDIRDNQVKVHLGTIKQINAGGKVWEEYDLGGVTRAESELYKSFDEAKTKAVKKQTTQNAKLMEWVNEINEQSVLKR